MEPPFRKPRLFFDTASHPSHVTFDDGHRLRRNFPWHHYVEARWAYGEPDAIQVLIGDWLVTLTGSNLAPLFTALEEHTLLRVRVESDAKDRERQFDTYVTRITFEIPIESASKRRPPQGEFDFPAG